MRIISSALTDVFLTLAGVVSAAESLDFSAESVTAGRTSLTSSGYVLK
jgi:hypothetical protein